MSLLKALAPRIVHVLNHAHMIMASKLTLFSPVSLLLLAAAVSLVSCKGGKKSEETKSFDVKPSGQIAHETLKLVRASDPPPRPLLS